MDTIPQNIPRKQCTGPCQRFLPATSEYFQRESRRKDGLRSICKVCRSAEIQAQAAANPNIWKERYRKYFPKTPEAQEQLRVRQTQNMRNSRAKRKPEALEKGMCISCFIRPAEPGQRCEQCREYHKQWSDNNREAVNAKQKQYRDELRNQVLNAYGRVCACCGEDNPAFLAVDHVHGGGREHVQRIKGHLYRWLKKNGFPQEGFQLLCHSCNHAKFVYGVCPHQQSAP